MQIACLSGTIPTDGSNFGVDRRKSAGKISPKFEKRTIYFLGLREELSTEKGAVQE
ncbi:hypothetical protein HMPREF9069_01480 [Atopobium sp. oral taxon 810 str. F0209]|nr:hypothetical protein HMPREF9069_01480 [Atopobium sp. oral taxon 810 str. F0209]